MIAALRSVRARQPRKLLAAVAVASLQARKLLETECDDLVCLESPAEFSAVGQFFNEFGQVTDEEVVDLLTGRQQKISACG